MMHRRPGQTSKQPAATKRPQHSVQCRGNRAEDELARRQFRQIGQDRGDKIAETQLAGLDEIAHGALGALKRSNQRLADIGTNVAGFGRIV